MSSNTYALYTLLFLIMIGIILIGLNYLDTFLNYKLIDSSSSNLVVINFHDNSKILVNDVISFDVCGGLTNQRISIIHGLLIAFNLKRHAIIMPMVHSSYLNGNKSNFNQLFEFESTRNNLKRVFNFEFEFYNFFPNNFISNMTTVKSQQWKSASLINNMIHLDCPFFQYTQDSMTTSLLWRINEALVPSRYIIHKSKGILNRLRMKSNIIITLHLRSEDDWINHCNNWQSINDGIIRDNCYTNTEMIDLTLLLSGIPEGSSIYIAGAYTKEDKKKPVFLRLFKKFHIFFQHDFLNDEISKDFLENQREIFAAVDYEICKESDIFIGNSVSTFSAMLLLTRERNRIFGNSPHIRHFHYNSGDIPLTSKIQIDFSLTPYSISLPLKWIFSYSSKTKAKSSTHTTLPFDYDDGVKVAVLSALRYTTLIPICLFYGKRNAIFDWLKLHGVIVIQHSPEWKTKILRQKSTLKKNIPLSHLYANPNMLIATFLRIDIPILGFADIYVLYTDADVIFVQDVSLNDFGSNLPQYFTMGSESKQNEICYDDHLYGNAGVMLMNLVNLRRTYKDFIATIFSESSLQKGLSFGKFGPADQGAYNYYYQGRYLVLKQPLFNWKAYWDYNPSASIIHFHGPKPIPHFSYLLKNGSTSGYKEFDGLLQECINVGLYQSPCSKYLDLFLDTLKQDKYYMKNYNNQAQHLRYALQHNNSIENKLNDNTKIYMDEVEVLENSCKRLYDKMKSSR